jgi:hypothetical protein
VLVVRGNDDSADKCTKVSSMSMRLDPLSSGTLLFSSARAEEHTDYSNLPSIFVGSISWVTALALDLGSNIYRPGKAD